MSHGGDSAPCSAQIPATSPCLVPSAPPRSPGSVVPISPLSRVPACVYLRVLYRPHTTHLHEHILHYAATHMDPRHSHAAFPSLHLRSLYMAPYRPISLHCVNVPPHLPPYLSLLRAAPDPQTLLTPPRRYSPLPPCCFTPFSSLTYSSPRCGDSCHPPPSAHGTYAISLCTSASRCCTLPCLSWQLHAIPPVQLHTLPTPAHQLPARRFHTPSSPLTLSYTLGTPLPDALLAHHTSTWYHHAPDHLLQPCNRTTSPCLPVIAALLHRSQTLHPHEAPHGLCTSPASPHTPKYFSSRQPITMAYLPASPQFPVLPSLVCPISLLLLNCFKLWPQAGASFPPSYKTTLFPHSSLLLLSKNLLFLLLFLNISVPYAASALPPSSVFIPTRLFSPFYTRFSFSSSWSLTDTYLSKNIHKIYT